MNIVQTSKGKVTQAKKWFVGLSLTKKIVIFCIVLGVLWFGILPLFQNKTTIPQYQTSTVERGTLVSTVSASGNVSSSNNNSVTTQLNGVIGQVYVKNGDYVNAGQTLMTITPDQASAQKQSAAYASYLSAQNNVNSAQTNLYTLQASLFAANQKFVNDKGTTDPDTDDPTYIQENATWLAAEATYKNQQNVIAAAQASLTSASLSYAQLSSTVTAPISGTVSGLSATPGSVITSSSSDSSSSINTVATIHTQGNPIVSVNLTEIDVPHVTVGDKVTVTFDAFSGKTFTGKVLSIDTTGSVSSGVTSYPASILLDTEVPGLLSNMSASVNIITEVKDDVLSVPTSAIQMNNGEPTVRVLKNGQVTSVSVTTGIVTDTSTEITSGLNEGDTVVTSTISTATSRTGTSTSPFGGNLRFGGGAGGFGSGGTTRTIIRQ